MIREVRLQSFKNFKDATLSLGNLSLLVGTNASGKSNLRDAFRFLHGMARGYTLAEIFGDKYLGGDVQWKGIRGGTREVAYRSGGVFQLETRLSVLGEPASTEWPVAILPESLTHIIRVEVGTNGGRPRVVREALIRGEGAIIYDSHPKVDPPNQEETPYLFVRLGDDNGSSGKSLRFLDSQPVLTQLPTNREAGLENWMWANSVIAELASMRFLDLTPDAMRKPSVPGQVVLGNQGEDLSSVLQAIWENERLKAATLEWIRELTPLDVSDLEFVADQTGKVLVTLVEAGGQRTSAHSASDGTLRFLAMIAAMLGPDRARFYFFEELDNGIHPTRLLLLLQLIEQSVADDKIQIVGTTHSPQLLAFLNPESQESASLVYRLPGQPDAHIRRILDLPEAKNVLRKHNLGRLHESGWLENVLALEESDEPALEATS